MSPHFTCDVTGTPEPLPHFWEFCVGSGRAALALRADWQAQLKQCHEELGFRHVRFHGLLDDDMGTLDDEKNELLYGFQDIDKVYGFLRTIDMRPCVGLSFMPRALSSGDQTVFHYKANVTPPADYGEWATLVSNLAHHWIERFGAKEVTLWPMEVWNEPNLESFWTGSREDYFRLFETTWHALKHVHPEMRVGGPVTANNQWITEFLDYCAKAGTPPDFISTHTYPTDALGSPDDDTMAVLSKGHLSILRERAETVREQVGNRTLYYTEWSTSSNPRDKLHDEPYAAAYIVHTLLDMGPSVQGYSYWTFSDLFAENYSPIEPFQGGFGLMTIDGVPKSSYRAFEILHRLGEERLPVQGHHETVSVWVVRSADRITVVAVNLALPLHPIEAHEVDVELSGLPPIDRGEARRIDQDHTNAKAKWKLLGKPRYPTAEEITALFEASKLKAETVPLHTRGDTTRFKITVPPQSVISIELIVSTDRKKADKPGVQIAVPHKFSDEDERLLNHLQAAAFGYFTRHTSPANGLVRDSSKLGSPASIAATGFALSCYPVAIERGWLDREQAIETTLRTLRFFAASRQGADADATGYKGFYYHFLNATNGERADNCELSTIDTALLLAGMITAAQYFSRNDPSEKEIGVLAGQLFERVDWSWTCDRDKEEFSQSWKPGKGFKTGNWGGYTEALILYVLAAASTSNQLPKKTHAIVARGYRWLRNEGLDWIHASPLFIHLFPQAWLDLRGLDDGYVSTHDHLDYFRNTQRAIAIQRAYALLNPHGFTGYSEHIWGLSSCQGPDGEREDREGEKHEFLSYAARGVPAGPDDGTLVPWAATACLAHEPEIALSGMHALLDAYPDALRDGRFVGAINPSLPGVNTAGWIAPACYGIDQGLVVMMIENARTGLIWELTRHSTLFRRGLKNIGFKSGWLDEA